MPDKFEEAWIEAQIWEESSINFQIAGTYLKEATAYLDIALASIDRARIATQKELKNA